MKEMERTEIYSSRKKSAYLLVGCMLFVALGVWLVLCSKQIAEQGSRWDPFYIKVVGAAGVVFFGLGIYVAVRGVVKPRLMLVIDETGIFIGPGKSLEKRIAWEQITGFTRITIYASKVILVGVADPELWVEQENNPVRRRMMEYNIRNLGSPFSIAPGSMGSSHAKLLGLLNEGLKEYRNLGEGKH